MRTPSRHPCGLLFVFVFAALVIGAAPPAAAQPGFDKTFLPDTIGAGSISTLEFVIDNSVSGAPVDDLAFTDVLPAGVTIASPPKASTTCGAGSTLSAPAGGSTISLSGGMVGASSSCIVRVDVTSSTLGTHVNVSGDLTSDAGNSGTAADDLIVATDRPGFAKSFSPSSVFFGGTSTLTFTIVNPESAPTATSAAFTDTFPTGMVVADPANVSNSCGGTFTATPGSNTVSLSSGGTLSPGFTCTISLDVVGGAVGMLGNTSGELTTVSSSVERSSGKAGHVLTVTGGASDPILLTKEFTDDPVAPGGTVTLRFSITNTSRDDSATAIAFTDDLSSALADLLFTSVGSNTCDATPTGTGTSTVSFSGGSLGPEASCFFEVSVTVPADATPGTYTNTSSNITATVAGDGVTGGAASALLFVASFPVLTKEFTNDPVGAGGTATLEFTITNPSTTSAMADIEFLDALTDTSGGLGSGNIGNGFLPSPVSVGVLPPTPCGAGSSLTLGSCGTDCDALSLTGGSLAANDGSPGGPDTCTFSLTVDIPAGFPAGTYTNTTGDPSATLSDLAGMPTASGPGASGDLVVRGAPRLTKEFSGGPVAPGGTVTLDFTVEHDALAVADATAIAFTDDLTTVAAGITAASVDSNACTGSTVDITTDPTMIDFSGGALTPGATCTVTLTLAVDGSSPSGLHTNTTSDVTATVLGVATTGSPAQDELLVSGLLFSKEFVGEPVIPGDTATLRFTLDNSSGATPFTPGSFTDSLSSVLPSLIAVAGPTPDPPCSATSSLLGVGTGSLSFVDAALPIPAGDMCSFDVTVMVPAGTTPGSYVNVTSDLFGGSATLPPATDSLMVEDELLAITKEFTSDPAAAGGTTMLAFTIENLDPTRTVMGITFDDDLDAALTGLVTSLTNPISNTCPDGMATTAFGTGTFSYDGLTLAPGADCTITLSLDVPAGPFAGNTFANSTSPVTGSVTGNGGGTFSVFGTPASDDLVVRTVTFSKGFVTSAVAGGSVALDFTIENLDSSSGVGGLAFLDPLSFLPGLSITTLPAAGSCGGATFSGTTTLSMTGGSLGPSGTCSFSATLAIPPGAVPGSYPNLTSALFSAGIPVADPAMDTLTIEAPPVFSKSFSPDTIFATQSTTLSFTIDNSASSTFAASMLAFSDALPVGLEIAAAPPVTNTCGGTVTAMAGANTISLAGGSVAAGADCSISIPITSLVTASGALVNTTGDLTSSSGNSGTAADTLTVMAAETDLGISKSDSPDPVTAGEALTYTMTVTNNGPSTSTGGTVTDVLPAGVTFSSSTDCAEAAGTVTCAIGALVVSDSQMVSFTVDVGPDQTAAIENTATVAANETDSTSGNDSATETTTVNAETDLAITKDDLPDPVTAGEALTYTVTVTNNGPSTSTGGTVTDVLPAGVTFSSSTDCAEAGGTVTCAIGALAVSNSQMVSFVVDVDPAQTAAISNTATIAANETDPASSNDSATETTAVSTSTDLGITKADSPDPVNAGDALTYTMTVTNNGPSASTGGTVTDVLPAGVTFNSSADCAEAGGTVTCAIGALAVSASQMVSFVVDVDPAQTAAISNTATIAANETDPASSNDSATETTAVSISTDLGITKDDAGATYVPGSTFTYTLTVINNGPSDSTGGSISDTLPASLSFVSSPSGCTEAGGIVTCPVGALADGASAVFTFTVMVAPGASSTIMNTATVSANETDPVPGNDSEDEATPREGVETDLGITKTDSPDPVTAGNALTYSMTVTNNGPSNSTGGTITDVLPAGTAFSSSADCTEAAGTVTCALGALTVSASETVSFVVDVDSAQTAAILNTATVAANETDTFSSNDSASATTAVNTATDLSISKSDSPDPATAGGALTYTIEVTNLGPSDSTGATVTDVLPAGVTFSSSADCAEAAGTVTCAIGALAVSASQTVSFVVDVDPMQTAAIMNTATVAANETDPVSTNDSATATTSLGVVTDLSITKSDSPDPVTAGGTLTYTIEVTNNGPSDSTGATVTDVLPAGVTFSSSADCAEAAGTVTCAIGALAVSASQTVSFVVDVDPMQTAAIMNTATVAANETDPISTNDSATATTSLGVATDLSITKSDSPDPVTAGDALTYTIEVTNNGPSDSTGATVTDVLPAGVTFSSSADCAEAAGTVTCAIGALTVSASQTVSFVVDIDPMQTAAIMNTAMVAANETDPVSTNDSATETTSVSGPLDDGDGVDAAIEDAGPNMGDCNMDGIQDSTQSDVTAVPSRTGEYLCFFTEPGVGLTSRSPIGVPSATVIGSSAGGTLLTACQHRNVATVDTTSLPPDQSVGGSFLQVRSPLGFELECSAATATILYFGIEDLSAATYRKFGPTADNATPNWYTLPATFGSQTIAGETVASATFELVDGGQGDHDLMANGTIVDPGGAAITTAGIPTLSEWALMLMALMLGGCAILVMRRL